DINLFRYCECIVDFGAKIANGALDLRVPEQELHGSQVAGAPVDQRRLCPPQRMRSEQPRIEPDAADPLGYKARVLAGRHATATVSAAREQKLAGLLAGRSQVVFDRLPGLLGQLEFDRPARLPLPDGRAFGRVTCGRHVLDLEGDQITTPKF